LLRSTKKLLALYWLIAYVFWLPIYVLLKMGYIDVNELNYFTIAIQNVLFSLILLLTALFIIRIKGENISKKYFGLEVSNVIDIIIYSGLAVLPFAVLYLIALFLIYRGLNIEPHIMASLPLFIVKDFSKELVPIVGIMHWTWNGIISFMLLQAFPYEIAEREFGAKKGFALTFILWSGMYNGLFYTIIFGLPLPVTLLGEIIDVVILGFIFLLVYRKVRNCLGLIIAYVFVYEAPVKACVYYGWGLSALIPLMILGILWQLVSLSIYIERKINILNGHNLKDFV